MTGRRGTARLAAALAAAAVLACACRLPNVEGAQAREQGLGLTSFVYAADGSLLTSLHAEQNRVPVLFSDIPLVVREAVVAVEDKRFYQHHGIDLRALLRAAYVNAKAGRVVEGGSTITEQYVKNTFVGSERSIGRKIKEAILAWQIEHRYTKDEILAKYLNTVYFGQGAYGIQAAAEAYFRVPVSKLRLPQAALLAGLIAAPSTYDPVEHPELARQRRDLVLSDMLDQGMITASEAQAALHGGLGLHLAPATQRYPAPYFVDYVKRWFLSNTAFGTTYTQRYRLLFEGGVRIYTTLRPDLQRDAEDAVGQVLIERTDPYGAMTVVDPRSGYIVAMVGGRDYFSKTDPVAKVNLATGGITGRQAGSAFKPFALVAALEDGIPPQKLYPSPPSIDIPLGAGSHAPVWHVTNYDGSAYGTISLEDATVESVNVVYAQLIRDLGGGNAFAGAHRVVEAAHRMGIVSPLEAVPSAVLGSNEVTTLEMASAYGTLADAGYHVRPIAVTKVVDHDGSVVWRAPQRRSLAVNPAITFVADGILQRVVQVGTGAAANIPRPAIGKTGTAQRYTNAWFVGAIPQLSAAVWVGFPQGQIPMSAPRTRIAHVLGGTWPADIWHAFMTLATARMPVEQFPGGQVSYVDVAIDVTRGCLPNPFTPPDVIQTVRFVAGTQPNRVCTDPSTPQPLPVPSVIGLPQDQAAQAIRDARFQVAIVTRPSDLPAGTVIAQDPPAGEDALQGSTVTITVAGPKKTVVPDVIGLSKDDAVAALQAAGFGVVIFTGSCDLPAGCPSTPGVVWKESPGAGTKVAPGGTVTIWLSPS